MAEQMQTHPVDEFEDLLEIHDRKTQDKLIRNKLNEKLKPYYIVTGFLFSLLILELFRWITDSPPLPVVVFGLFMISLFIALYQLRDVKDRIKFLQAGKQGEPDITSVLNDFDLANTTTLHRNVFIDSNLVDFVLVDHTGIVLINLQELQVPTNSEAIISYDDEQVYLNGYRPEENPLAVLRLAHKSLGSYIYASIGKSVPVETIVIFPQWYVEEPKIPCHTKVINPRNLAGVLQARKPILSDNEASLLKHHTSKLFKRSKQG